MHRPPLPRLACLLLLAAGLTGRGAAAAAPISGGSGGSGGSSPAAKEIEAFNEKFRDAILHMDNAATMALWADGGVTLLPGSAPISGKATIAKWMDDVVARLPGYHVTRQDNEFHDIRVSGDWASEWGTTHQTVQPPDGKPALEIYGKILLVLHRDAGGAWKIQEEMWNNIETPARP